MLLQLTSKQYVVVEEIAAFEAKDYSYSFEVTIYLKGGTGLIIIPFGETFGFSAREARDQVLTKIYIAMKAFHHLKEVS